MIRGDVVTVATGGGYGGKPRPALIIQSDLLIDKQTLIVLGFSTDFEATAKWRPIIQPDNGNGLREPSMVMTDLPIIARRTRVGKRIGRLAQGDLRRVELGLMLALGLT